MTMINANKQKLKAELTHKIININLQAFLNPDEKNPPHHDAQVTIYRIKHDSIKKKVYVGGCSKNFPADMYDDSLSLDFTATQIDEYLKEHQLILNIPNQSKLFLFSLKNSDSLALPESLGFELAEKLAQHVFYNYENISPSDYADFHNY